MGGVYAFASDSYPAGARLALCLQHAQEQARLPRQTRRWVGRALRLLKGGQGMMGRWRTRGRVAGRWLLGGVVVLGALSVASWPAETTAQERDSYKAARLKMVEEEIAREGITNTAVLKALRQVPRHQLGSAAQRPKAYLDQSLPIGHT